MHDLTSKRPPLLRIAALVKSFGGHVAVDHVSLDLAQGEVFCLLGPSGCGKSTLLRMIAGFETPDAGTIRLGDEEMTRLPPHRRPVNMMFQSYALFPHMSVAGNVAYGLSGLGLSRAEIAERVDRLLRMVRLEAFASRRPDRLSGGQRQRVALARALGREPKVLLLDEPLGALDRALREETQGELRALQRRLGTSFVVVTHDPEEAMALADRIGVMDRGRLVQVGSARELYERPASRFVAGLLGDVNLIAGRLLAIEPDGSVCVETRFGMVRAGRAGDLAAEPGAGVTIAIRPEQLRLSAEASRTTDGNAHSGTILDAAFLGDRIRRQVRMSDGTTLRTSSGMPGDTGLEVGATVQAVFTPEAALVLPE